MSSKNYRTDKQSPKPKAIEVSPAKYKKLLNKVFGRILLRYILIIDMIVLPIYLIISRPSFLAISPFANAVSFGKFSSGLLGTLLGSIFVSYLISLLFRQSIWKDAIQKLKDDGVKISKTKQ